MARQASLYSAYALGRWVGVKAPTAILRALAQRMEDKNVLLARQMAANEITFWKEYWKSWTDKRLQTEGQRIANLRAERKDRKWLQERNNILATLNTIWRRLDGLTYMLDEDTRAVREEWQRKKMLFLQHAGRLSKPAPPHPPAPKRRSRRRPTAQ